MMAARWGAVPIPGDEYDISPGFALAAAMTSCTLLYGLSAAVTTTSGLIETNDTGTKSVSKNFCALFWINGVVVTSGLEANKRV